MGSVVGVVAASQRAVAAQVEGGGLGGQLSSSRSAAAGHPAAAVGRRRLGRRLCVASCAGRTTRPSSAAASTTQRLGRSRRRCLRCGRGRPRQCGRSVRGTMVSTGGVDVCQGRGFARGAVGFAVVVLAASLALLLGRALGGLPSQLAGRSRRCRLPSSRGRLWGSSHRLWGSHGGSGLPHKAQQAAPQAPRYWPILTPLQGGRPERSGLLFLKLLLLWGWGLKVRIIQASPTWHHQKQAVTYNHRRRPKHHNPPILDSTQSPHMALGRTKTINFQFYHIPLIRSIFHIFHMMP